MQKSTLVDDLAADPILIPHDGRLKWLFPSGRLVRDVSGGEGEGGEKQFTQADLDRIIQDRLAQWQRNNPPAKPDDYDAIKSELAQLKASQGTELDRAKGRITELEGQLAAVTGERDTARVEIDGLKLHRVEDAFKVAVGQHARTSNNPEQVYALLDKSKLTIGDDGQVKGADEAVKTFLEANPHFVGQPQRLQKDPALGQRTADIAPSVAAGREMFESRKGSKAAASTTSTP